MRRLLGIGSVYTLGAVAQMSAAAIAVPAITRLLGARSYGEVSVVIAITVILHSVVSLGLPFAVERLFYGAEDLAEDGPVMARKLVGACTVAAAVGVALTAASTVLWSRLLEPVAHVTLLIGVATALPLTAMLSTMVILQVEQRPAPYLAVALLGSAGAQAFGIGAVVLVDTTPTVYLAGYAGGVAAAAVVGAILSKTATAGLPSRRTMRTALAFGLPTVPHAVAIFVLALGDRVIILNIAGTLAVGRYQVAYGLGSLAIALLYALQTAWIPVTFGASAERRWVDLADSALVITRLGALLVTALVVLSPLGLAILAPASFDPGELQAVSALVALGALPLSMYLPMVQVLFWERKTKALLWVTPAAAVANLGLAALLLHPFGLEGVAAATFLACVLQAVLVERVTRRVARVPWHWQGMLLNVGAGALAVVAVLALPDGGTGVVARALTLAAVVVLAGRTLSEAVGTREADA